MTNRSALIDHPIPVLAATGALAAIIENLWPEFGLPLLKVPLFGHEISAVPGAIFGALLGSLLCALRDVEIPKSTAIVIVYTALVTLAWIGPVELAFALDGRNWAPAVTGAAAGAAGGAGMAVATALFFAFFRDARWTLLLIAVAAVAGTLLYFTNLWLLMIVWQGAVCAVIGMALARRAERR